MAEEHSADALSEAGHYKGRNRQKHWPESGKREPDSSASLELGHHRESG